MHSHQPVMSKSHLVLANAGIGVGLRHPHYQHFLSKKRDVAFLEVHPENYFCGGKNKAILDDIAQDYTLSLHGVGLSLGSADGVDHLHITRLKELVDHYQPALVSDHVSWSRSGNAHLGDLLPLPYNSESLDVICRNIDRVQHALQRQILVENPSSYCSFTHSTYAEADFMNLIAQRSGCGLILDINNIYVQAHNHGDHALDYINTIKPDYVKEMHLAGHISQDHGGVSLLIDTHSRPVADGVWSLYDHAITRFAQAYTLIEWDADIPEIDVLMGEAYKAARLHELLGIAS